MGLCGISSRFQLLSPSLRQVPHALLTRSPLDLKSKLFISRSTCMCQARRQRSSWARIKLFINDIYHLKVLNLSSLSTQSLASCVNYFVWNCLPCFSNTKIGSVTSFSILFNFQGPVSASADRLTTWLFYHRSDFLSSSFLEAFERSELGCFKISQISLGFLNVYWFFSKASCWGFRSHSFVSALSAQV